MTDRSHDAAPERLARGAQVGRYLILDVLGSGGMGVVYGAYDPELDRRVALKLVRPDVARADGEASVRLAREARAVARLSHPNVVTVHDVGSFGEQVFVAMELVDGRSVKEWLAEPPSKPWRDVLEVFLQAGRGLAASHAAGLVHRDFKPANVLLGKDGRARVTDFGLARLAEGHHSAGGAADLSLEDTGTGTLVGTPAYMAPEQLAGREADARADQFSFAVALYEALGGVRPFAGGSIEDLRDEISSRRMRPPLREIPRWVRRAVSRALDRDPAARHPSMAAFLDALAPPVRGRGWWIAAGLAAALALAAAVYARRAAPALCTGAETRLAEVWNPARRQALHGAFRDSGKPWAESSWRRVEAAIDDYGRSWTAMRTEACETTQLRGEQSVEVMDLRMACLDERQRDLEALLRVLAQPDAEVLQNAAKAAESLAPITGCADVRALIARVRPPAGPAAKAQAAVIESQIAGARHLDTAGKYRESLALADGATAAARAFGYPPLLAPALIVLGRVHDRLGSMALAESELEEAVQAAEAGHDDHTAATAWNLLVYVVGYQQSRFDDGLRLARFAAAAVARAGDPQLDIELATYRGAVLQRAGRLEEALAEEQRALDLSARGAQPEGLGRVSVLINAAVAYQDLGRWPEALQLHHQALELCARLLGPDHPFYAAGLQNLANLLKKRGDYAEAERAYRQALAIRERAFGADHPEVGDSLDGLAMLLREERHYDEALALMRRAAAIDEKAFGAEGAPLAKTLANLGSALLEAGKTAEARATLERALAIMERQEGKDHPDLANLLGNLAWSYADAGQFDLALAQLRRARAILDKSRPSDHPDVAANLEQTAEILLRAGRGVEAIPYFRRALALEEHSSGAESHTLSSILTNLAAALVERGQWQEALGYQERALAIDESSLGPDNPGLVEDLADLGATLAHLGRAREAVPLLERAVRLGEPTHAEGTDRARAALLRARRAHR